MSRESNLHAAVLMNGLKDLMGWGVAWKAGQGSAPTDEMRRFWQNQAFIWFTSRPRETDGEEYLSFDMCCRAVGLCPKTVRHKILGPKPWSVAQACSHYDGWQAFRARPADAVARPGVVR